MAEQITKLVIRKGLLQTGKSMVLQLGEPGFTTDTKRLYIGDSARQHPGTPIGIKNFLIQNFVDPFTFTNELTGAEVGDIVYDDDTNLLYFLTGGSETFPGTNELNWIKIPFVIELDNDSLELNILSAAQIKNNGVKSKHINTNIVGNGLIGGAGTAIAVNVDNYTLDISENKVRLKPGSVPVSYLGAINENSVLVNANPFKAPIEQLYIPPGYVLGRFTGNIAPISFATVVQNGSGVSDFEGRNGIDGYIDQSVQRPRLISFLNRNMITAKYDPEYPAESIFSVSAANVSFYTGGLSPNIYLGGNTTLSGSLLVRGLIRSTGDIVAFTSSDKRLKKNITPIDSSLDKVEHLRGVNFNWIENDNKDVGVIAQEVEQVIPEAVETREDGTKAVNYSKIIPLLINAIKELKHEINNLKNEKV
jgi:hypothetical protein